MKFFKKLLPSIVGAGVGAVTGSPMLGFGAAAATRGLTGQKTDLLTLGMDFAAGWGGTRLPGMFDGGTTATTGPVAAGLGAGATAGAAPGAAAAPAAAAGVATKPQGLLSGVLNSQWLNNPVVGYTLAGVGTALASPGPEEAYKAQHKYGQMSEEERRRRAAENYRRVPAPSDRGLVRSKAA